MICFLVNGNQHIGSGHVRRCLSLAGELRKAGQEVFFISWSLDQELKAELDQLGFSCRFTEESAIPKLPAYLATLSISLLVIDSDDERLYGKEWQHCLREHNLKFMFITVNDSPYYYADIVLNQSILAMHQTYSGEPYTKFLLGPEFFLFGERFRHKQIEPVRRTGDTVFVGFGAADPAHYTSQILEGMSADDSFREYHFKVVVGNLNRQWTKIERTCSQSPLAIELYRNEQDMSSIYADCDLALCSAGVMFWELSLFGVQAMILSASKRETESACLLDTLGYATLLHQYGDTFSFEAVADKFKQRNAVAPRLQDLQRAINPNGIAKFASEICQLVGIGEKNENIRS